MNTLLLKVRTIENVQLTDDEFVEQCMKLLMERYPVITGYTYERIDREYLNVMIWGEHLEFVEE